MEEFAITLKFNQKPDCVPSDYLSVLEEWKDSYGIVIHENAFEPDNKGICHMHGIIAIPKGFYRKRMQRYGLHVMIRPIKDRQGWIRYMYKSYRRVPPRELPGRIHI